MIIALQSKSLYILVHIMKFKNLKKPACASKQDVLELYDFTVILKTSSWNIFTWYTLVHIVLKISH